MKKVKDLNVGDIVYSVNDCCVVRLLKVKEIEEVRPFTYIHSFNSYRVVLAEMDDRILGTFNLYPDRTEFDDYDWSSVTYYLNKEDVKVLLNDTLNEVNESLRLLEEY